MDVRCEETNSDTILLVRYFHQTSYFLVVTREKRKAGRAPRQPLAPYRVKSGLCCVSRRRPYSELLVRCLDLRMVGVLLQSQHAESVQSGYPHQSALQKTGQRLRARDSALQSFVLKLIVINSTPGSL